jgi:hypothetical protein
MSKFQKILVVLLVIVGLAGIGVGTNMYIQSRLDTTTVTKVFADINGDGKLDLIVRADVIFNASDQENLSVSQLSKP